MEICGMKNIGKGGWSIAEEALLFDCARKARSEGRPLRTVFSDVAEATGRKPNSIRNHYYTRVREEGGGEPRGAAFVPFSADEARSLLKTVLSARSRGMSVRACTLDMGGGDTRLMLRYQNKYRALIKNDPALVRSVMEELSAEGTVPYDPYAADFEKQDAVITDAFSFFQALEELAAKYKRMTMRA